VAEYKPVAQSLQHLPADQRDIRAETACKLALERRYTRYKSNVEMAQGIARFGDHEPGSD